MQNQNKRITIEVIESKEFRVAAKGYNQHEVDEFLDCICDELERLEAEMDAMKRDLEIARQQKTVQAPAAPVAAAPAPAYEKPAENTFREILEMAQRVKEQTIADAQAKAEQIVADAQTEITARLGNLEAEKEELTAQVDSLRNAAKSYKAQFAALIRASQEALDQAEDL